MAQSSSHCRAVRRRLRPTPSLVASPPRRYGVGGVPVADARTERSLRMTQVAEPGSARAEVEASGTPGSVHHWIGGRSVEGTSGRRGRVYDPATGRLAREVDFASADEVGAAVA